MRIVSGSWLAILALGLLAIGATVAPCHAVTSNSPTTEATPIVTNATLSGEETIPSKAAFQPSYLSLSITTDKSVYLTGEPVSITVSTNAFNTHIRLQAELPDGNQETIDSFTTNETHTLSWQAPSTPGLVRFTCEGEGMLEVWDTCLRSVCVSGNCSLQYYPCLRSVPVTGSTYSDIRIFSRTTSISGYITDTNQQPVPGARVSLTSTMQSTTSNSDGYYEFSSYQLGNDFGLYNQIPTVSETVSVEAIACEPQPGKTVQVQAEQGASDVNFTLRRSFYPPGIDLSEFTFDAFSDWPEATEYSTWQNILGITIEGAAEPSRLSYQNKEISSQLFNIGNKKLYLVTNPEFGSYFLELQGARNTAYTVAAATTLNNLYFEPVTISGNIAGKNDQRLKLTLSAGGIELKLVNPASLLLIIIPIVVVILGGLAAAYFLTRGKFRFPWEKPAARKPSKAKARVRTKTKRDSTATKINKPATKKK